MKIIMLDVDGVVNTARTRCWPGRPEPLDAEAVKNLNAITDATGAVIVLSSTWRLGTEADFQAVVKQLQNNGITAPFIGRTPSSFRGYRGAEIEVKVKELGLKPKDFVIIDDESDMKPYMSRLVQTKYATGLTEEDAQRAIELLKD